VFVYLLALYGRGASGLFLFDMGLESGDLLVDVGNVLFDDKSEFL